VSADEAPPLVLAVVGTDHHPFDRLVDWMTEWLRSVPGPVECLIQHGTAAPPEVGGGIPYLDHPQLVELMGRAVAVVTHGGPATIVDCRRLGRLPIAVPRRKQFGEHVDDHQVRFVERIAADGIVREARSAAELARWLDTALADPSSQRFSVPAELPAEAAVARFGAFAAAVVAGGQPRRLPGRPRRIRLGPDGAGG
jgi:UDP-N-acetylglucosamine transferase subunit ALG13